MTLLYINACVRKASRTKELADYLVSKTKLPVTELNLAKLKLRPLDEATLEQRNALIAGGNFENPMFDYAKMFAAADEIVIGAPFWDLSFPANLKVFIEHIDVLKIVFDYSEKGEVVPLCKAKKLYYITTKGGVHTDNFGFGYIQALCKTLYGIKDVILIEAENLDIQGTDVADILAQSKKQIDELFRLW